MRAADQLNTSVQRFVVTTKTALFSSLLYLGVAAGLAAVPVSGFAALNSVCPMQRFTNTSNICTSGDISFATALVADTQVGGCIPGQLVAVSLTANLELNGNNTRYDPAIFVSKDGSPINLTIANGGPEFCEVMPIQGVYNADPDGMGPLAITDVPPGDGDLCSDTVGGGGATVSGVALNIPGGPTFDDPVVISCIAGPGGTLEISAMIVWDNSNPGVCDGTNVNQYPNDKNRCSFTTGEVPVDVLGRVTIIKEAAGAGALPFTFAYGVDNDPVNAVGINPTDPFFLQNGQSVEIFGEIGTTGSAQIIVGEDQTMNPPGWSLSNIVCTGDDTQPVNVNLAGGFVTIPLIYDAMDPDNSQSDITCTFTNVEATANLTLQKEWVNGAASDTAGLMTDGVNDGMATSTATGAAGSEVDTTNTVVTVATPGETVTFSETLGMANTGSYATSFACTGNTNAPTYTPGATSATLLIDVADTDVTCTFTNTRVASSLTLVKEWVDGAAGDTAGLTLDGFNDDNSISTATGAAGSEIDVMNGAAIAALSGETVTLSEALGMANTGAYTTSFACTGNTNAPTYTPGATTATLDIDAADSDITCTYSNTRVTSSLTLRKEWVDGILNDTADLSTDGVNDGMATSTSSGVAGSEVDNTNTVVTTALSGETVTLSETLGGGNTGMYATGFACTGNTNAPVYNPGATSATLLIDPADTNVVCTYTNTLQTSGLTLRKQWVDGVMNDTAMLMTDGVNDGNNTSTASGTPGSEIDNTNTVVTTALAGETVTLSEILGGGNTGVYTTAFSCTGSANAPTYTPGATTATLVIDPADTNIVCTYSNAVQFAGLTLRKEWVDGVLNDTAALMTDGVNDGNNTSTSSGAKGSEVDNVNTVVTTTLVGETVTMSEMLGGGNTGLYTTSFACTGNANPPTYTPGATTATLLVDASDTSVVCTFTNTLQSASLTLRKEWIDGAAGDTAGLTSSGFEFGTSSSMASGAPGSEVDNVNTVVTTALVGETVTLSEMLGGGNTGTYDVSFNCTGNTNAPTYTPGDTSATLDVDGADTDIVCTYTNTRQTDRLVLRKEWVDGAASDTADLNTDGVNDGMATSTASGAPGSEVDDTNRVITVALSGETVTLSEMLGGGNVGSYGVSFACTGNTNAPVYTPGATAATLLIDGGDNEIICTYTNTRQTSSLTLRKEWVDGALDDTADLNTDGVNDGNATSTATGAAGSEIDNTNTVVTTALSGETVTLSEMLGGANTGSYDVSFACAGNTNAPTYAPGDTSATLDVDGADTDIVCTYTNTRQTSSLTLRKEWVDGALDDTADLNTDGVNDGNATSTATGAAGSEIDNTNTVVTTALSGETVTLSEMLGGANTGSYDVSFACTGNTNAPTYAPGDTSATLDVDGADTDIVCTYTNTRQTSSLTLRKEWVDALVDDTADLNTDGVNDGNATSTATGAAGSEIDNTNTVVTTALSGETVTLSEMLGAGNTSVYNTSFACTGNTNAPTYTPGDTSATLVIDGADTAIVCTYTNTVVPAAIDLIKTVVPDSVTLEGDGSYTVQYVIEANNSSNGAGQYNIIDNVAPGSGITLNTATIAYQMGVGEADQSGMIDNAYPTMVTGESLAGNQFERWDLTVNFTVDPPTVDPVNSDCTPGAPVTGTGFYNEVSGSDTDPNPGNNADCDGLPDPEIDLAKTITNVDDSVPGTMVVTYEITATNLGDGPGFYDLIDNVEPAAGVVIVSAELVSYNAGTESSQDGMLTGPLPYSFTSGELLVDDEPLAGQRDEGWTIVVEFDVSATSGEFECNGAGTGTYNSVTGSDTDPNPGNNADCEDIERLRTSFVVTKDFSDDNPLGVTVIIDCNTGLPLMQQGVVHDPDAAGLQPGDFTQLEFIVNDFLPGTMDCDIEEVIPAGYVPTYTAGATTGVAADIFDDEFGCHYEDIEGGQFTCAIFNELQPVDVVVEKEWIDDNPGFNLPTIVEVLLECDGPIIGGFPCIGPAAGNGRNYCADAFIDPNNPGVFPILPHFEGTNCFAVEGPIGGVLTDQSDCESMTVFPGQGDSCVIVNTRLYAGIPTLSQYGLLVLMLMMFGVGAVAYRRFV